MNDSIRVLHVVPSLNRAAGVARFVRNMEQYHDEKRVHYDFLHHSTRDGVYMHDRRYDEELKASGCEVFTVIINNTAVGVHHPLPDRTGNHWRK